MIIRRLKISNYRMIQELEIYPISSRGYNIVVLIGEGGTGKSSILELLSALLRHLSGGEIAETDFRNRNEPINVELDVEGLSEGFVSKLGVPSFDNQPLRFAFSVTYHPERVSLSINGVTLPRPPRLYDEMACFYFAVTGRGTNQPRWSYGDDQGTNEPVDPRWNASLLYGQDKKTKEALIASLSLLMPEQLVQIDGEHLTIDRAAASVDDHGGFGMRQVGGDGSARLFSLATYRHVALQESAGIFAVDEPELHLHPQRRRALINYLLELSRTRQVWLATHDTSFVQRVDPRCLVRLTREAGAAKAKQLPVGFLSSELKRLERILDPTNAEVFFAPAVLVVEGPTEMGAVPVFSKRLGAELDYAAAVFGATSSARPPRDLWNG